MRAPLTLAAPRRPQLAASGTLALEGFSPVPDQFVRSQELEAVIKARAAAAARCGCQRRALQIALTRAFPSQALRNELAAVRAAASVATGSWAQLRKERDFHRMHHKRVAQEKDKLVADVKRLRAHYAQVREPETHSLFDLAVPATC